MSVVKLDENIFNVNKKTSVNESGSLFFGDKQGLIDIIEIQNQPLFDLYKKLKKQDWDEKEQDYSKCKPHFQTASTEVYESMILNITWQWETDSVAARSIFAILSPFISDPILTALYQRIGDNEILHSFTYSEIVKQSFDDPRKVKEDILQTKQTLERLQPVIEVFGRAYEISHKYALGLVDEDTARETCYEFIVAMLVLERVGFMGSFANTFAHCMATPGFSPIGFAVKKIASDELEVHAKVGIEIIKHECKTEIGLKTFKRLSDRFTKIIIDVANAEIEFSKFVSADGRELPGAPVDKLISFTMFNIGYVCDCIPFIDKQEVIKQVGHDIPSKNPLKFIEKWINMDMNQGSPMEQKTTGQYLINAVRDTAGDKVFDVEF